MRDTARRGLHEEPFWKLLLSFPCFSYCAPLGKLEGTKQQLGGTLSSRETQSPRPRRALSSQSERVCTDEHCNWRWTQCEPSHAHGSHVLHGCSGHKPGTPGCNSHLRLCTPPKKLPVGECMDEMWTSKAVARAQEIGTRSWCREQLLEPGSREDWTA